MLCVKLVVGFELYIKKTSGRGMPHAKIFKHAANVEIL